MRLRKIALLLSMGLSFQVAQAEEVKPSDWMPDNIKFNVFGTIGASHHNQDGLAYRRNQEQKATVEANKWDFASDSVVGGQLSYLFNDKITSTLMVVSRNNAWDNYKPEVISAFVKYAPVEALQFRVGRIPMDLNLTADSRFVGYSYINARPAPELFGLLAPYDRYEGVDVNYLKPIASGVLGLRLNYGNVVGERYINNHSSRIKDTDISGLVANWQTDNFELRAFRVQVDVNNFDAMLSLADSLTATGTALGSASTIQRANEIREATDFKIDVYGAGFHYDYNRWKLTVAGAQLKSGQYPAYHGENGLVMLAYRHEKLTPYASFAYARYKPESRPLNLPAIPALQALTDGYKTATEILHTRQSTVSLGMRYDFNDHYALKMQVDKINADSTPLTLTTDGATSNKDMTLFTIAVDFLF